MRLLHRPLRSDATFEQVLDAPATTATSPVVGACRPLLAGADRATTAEEYDEPAASSKQDEEPLAATQHEELVAYPNVFRAVGKKVPAKNTRVYIDSAASGHNMVSGESPISQHVVNLVDCDVRIEGSCSTPSATKKDTLKYKLKNSKGLPRSRWRFYLCGTLGQTHFLSEHLPRKG